MEDLILSIPSDIIKILDDGQWKLESGLRSWSLEDVFIVFQHQTSNSGFETLFSTINFVVFAHMFNKSLVAIYFLENRLLVAELDSQKKKVTRFASVEIPKGLIEYYKIIDKPGLTAVIKSIWVKSGFTEKTVGIIIPEFSTFSKLISLPKLAVGELHEAVLWQAQEFLPNGVEKMIIDWKIVARSEDGYEVLVYAVAKDILLDYVDVCESAGLFPHGVQTPSICLTNLTSQEDGSLTIYSGFNETILLVSNKDKILGTSVVQNTDQNEALETAIKMYNHYGKVNIKRIFVGGKTLSDQLIKGLKDNLKLDTTLLKFNLTGVEPLVLMDLIIPIALLMGELKDPSDIRTINLLPGNLVEKYKTEKTRVQVWSLTLTTTLFTWFCFLIVLGSYLVVNQQILALKSKNQEKSQIAVTLQKSESVAKQINVISDKVLNIKSNTVFPETVLNLIIDAKTPGVVIDKYKMDFDRGNVEITGRSSDRESLIVFKQNLEKYPEVHAVDIPISSFENDTNLEFTLSFQYGLVAITAVPNLNTRVDTLP